MLTSTSIKMTLKEDRKTPSECTIVLFLALAFADNAFRHFSCPQALLSYMLKPNRHGHKVVFKPEILDKPIFRMAKTNSSKAETSPTTAWTCQSSARTIGNLALRAGFPYPVRLYDLRRGSSNILNSKLQISSYYS